jgi:midasin (ATPase involved in ribosome maturation)
MIANAIEQIYNENWQNRGVLPYDKDQLVKLIVKGEFRLLDQVNFTELKTSDVPEFLLKRVVDDTRSGYISACLAKVRDASI